MSETPRAAIYCRVSTEDQARDGLSLTAQERTLHDRAAADGADVVSTFTDKVSGAKIDRPEYQRMLAAAAAGELDVVYVWKLDRLGRDAEELLRARRMLGAAGVRLVSATEGEDESTLVYGVRALVAQEEREKIAERTRMGLREVGRSGRWRGGKPPLGYRIGPDGHLEVVPADAQVARRIFADYLNGIGINRIAAGLNRDGLRTRNGAHFSARAILGTLQCRTYLGEIASGDETLAVDAHEPIIDAETWERAQRLRAGKRTTASGGRGRPPKRHLLAGLLRCPHGHTMIAKRWGHEEYYVCQRRHSYSDCETPNISRRKVDETLLSHFLNRHYDEAGERERLLAAAHAKGAESRALAAQADREEHEAQVALDRIRRDYQRGAISAEEWREFRADLTEEAQASRNRAAQLRARAAELEAEAEQVDTEAQLAARLSSILRAAAGRADEPEGVAAMRAALAATFDHVVFTPGATALAAITSPEPGTVLLGAAELVPVLRPELGAGIAAHGNEAAAIGGGASVTAPNKAAHASASGAGSPPPS